MGSAKPVGAENAPKSTPSPGKQLFSCLAYAGVSVTLSFVTKALFSLYGFRFPFFVMSLQLAFALLITSLMKLLPQYSPMPMPPLNWDTLRESVPQSALFVLNVIVSFQGMARVNIPLFLCLRRTTLAFVMLGEIVVLGSTFKRSTKVCVGLIVAGAVVAGWDSLSDVGTEATPVAFGYVAVNNLCTAMFLTLSKRFTNRHNIKAFGLVFYQSLVGLPIALTAMLFFDEPTGLMTFEAWGNPMFQFWLLCSGGLGLAIVYTILVANQLNSPLTIGVTGAVKDVAASGFSLLLFQGFQATFYVMVGLGLSLIGTLAYTVEKGLAAQAARSAPAASPRNSPRKAMSPV